MTLLLAIVSMLPSKTVWVDLIEANTTYYATGGKLDQIILWQWSSDYRRYDVLCWWEVAKETWPEKSNGAYQIAHPLGKLVRSRFYRRTWTERDPEIEQRKYLPSDKRQWRL